MLIGLGRAGYFNTAPHFEILSYFNVRFAGILVVLSNIMVHLYNLVGPKGQVLNAPGVALWPHQLCSNAHRAGNRGDLYGSPQILDLADHRQPRICAVHATFVSPGSIQSSPGGSVSSCVQCACVVLLRPWSRRLLPFDSGPGCRSSHARDHRLELYLSKCLCSHTWAAANMTEYFPAGKMHAYRWHFGLQASQVHRLLT